MRWKVHICSSAFSLIVAASLMTQPARAEDETPSAATEPAEKESKPGWSEPRYYARLRLEYERRWQGDSVDSDLYSRLYASGQDLREGRLDYYLSGRIHSDLDGTSSTSSADDPYHSVEDSNGVTEDRLLQLYGDMHSRDRRVALRAGRQYIEVADYAQVDGAQFMYNERGTLGGRIYVGHPVSYYTSVSGDYAGGFSVIGRPWARNRTRLSFARYHDDSEPGDKNDQNYFLDMQEELSDEARARAQLSVLNDEFRFGRMDLSYVSEDGGSDFSLGSSYWGSFDANTRVYSPLYDVLGEQDPYAQVYARLTKELVPKWSVSPGVSLRFADADKGNEQNNRDYANYDVTLIYSPDRSFSASLALEYWAVEDSDSFVGLSGEIRYRHSRTWEVSGGASFAQYTYDTFSDISYTANGGQTVLTETGTVIEESPFVRTYFVRGKWKMTKRFTGRLQFDIEDDDASPDLAYRGRASIEVRY